MPVNILYEIWKDSFARAPGFPPVPPDMNVPQFVSLAYDRNCHFRGIAGAKHMVWAARLRFCKRCLMYNNLFVNALVYRLHMFFSDSPS
ncbi:hypothetical protein HDZ31DRAFT_63484 [Schizophyllum fasciatum]